MTEVTINISDKMFGDDIRDKFADFFNKVIADIADSLNNDDVKLCGRYELETASLLRTAFQKGTYDVRS